MSGEEILIPSGLVNISTPTERLVGHMLSEQAHLKEDVGEIKDSLKIMGQKLDDINNLKQKAIGGSIVISSLFGLITFFASMIGSAGPAKG